MGNKTSVFANSTIHWRKIVTNRQLCSFYRLYSVRSYKGRAILFLSKVGAWIIFCIRFVFSQSSRQFYCFFFRLARYLFFLGFGVFIFSPDFPCAGLLLVFAQTRPPLKYNGPSLKNNGTSFQNEWN